MADADDQQLPNDNPELSGFSSITQKEVAELHSALNKMFVPYSWEVSQCILTLMIYNEMRDLNGRIERIEKMMERFPI